ncbi:PilZ domain-containing protein [Acinetobacter equi]|nr:PilZ domain-containing protein [Acinetobacter equi]
MHNYELRIDLSDKEALYHSDMPYVLGGGLFIPSKLNVSMGEVLSIRLVLPEEEQEILLKAKVVWMSQKQNGIKPQGFGVQILGEDSIFYKAKAEKLLAGIKANARSSYTM